MSQIEQVAVIAIAGASASGKSRLTDLLVSECQAELGVDAVSVLHEDAYYKRHAELTLTERCQINYDHPDAFEYDLLHQHLIALKQGQGVAMPVYDYSQHQRSEECIWVKPAKVIIVEGILVLANSRLLPLLALKVYMDTALDICLLRRMQRDIEQRGRSMESVMKQYLTTVRPMYYQFIEPSREQADIIVTRGGENRMAKELLKAQVSALVG